MNRKKTDLVPNSDTLRVHMHAYERLKEVSDQICSGKYPTKADLAELTGLNKRTIQRYIETLRRLGAPIEFDYKHRGFYFTDPTWSPTAIVLTEGELIGFFTVERLLQHLGSASAEVKLAKDALSRLAKLLPREVVINPENLSTAINFAPDPALNTSAEILQQLALAATRKLTIKITYFSQRRNAEVDRELDVLLVHQHLGEWYAVAYDHLSQEIRDFHAGRISSLVLTDTKFTTPEGWNAETYLQSGFGMFRGGKDVTVEIIFDSYQARYVRERRFHPTQQHQELSNGRLKISFNTTEAALLQVSRWVLQYGYHAQVIAPKELIEMVCETVNKTLHLYQNERISTYE